MSESLFSMLTDHTSDLHARTLEHPTIRGIGKGTLPEETFRYYIEQDYQFLTRYVQVLAMGVATGNSLDITTRMADLLHSTLAVEMDALRDLYARFGGDRGHLARISRSPTCAAYTNHLLSVASERNLLLTLASILPCQWGYREIGRMLKADGLPEDERYAAWIEEYAAEEYGELVEWVIETFNKLADVSGDAAIDRTFEIFQLSSEYEYRFWEMAGRMERW